MVSKIKQVADFVDPVLRRANDGFETTRLFNAVDEDDDVVNERYRVQELTNSWSRMSASFFGWCNFLRVK